MTLAPHTAEQIARLEIDPGRPLLICDVDEVVVHFLRGLEQFLARQDLWLDAASFALNGNIKCARTDAPVAPEALSSLLHEFFVADVASLDMIEGADTALAALARQADIVMLTNLPAGFHDKRLQNLRSHGLQFPLVSNSGPKGPAVAAITGEHRAPVAFIDDNPSYLESVHAACPQVGLVHFMQDERFAVHVPDLPFARCKTDNWETAHGVLSELLGSAHV